MVVPFGLKIYYAPSSGKGASRACLDYYIESESLSFVWVYSVRILLTAFEPYDQWQSNSSWDALVELLRTRGTFPNVVTRRYPVDLRLLQDRLQQDLERGFDAILHIGQSPGLSQVHLESICLNVAGMTGRSGDEFGSLLEDAPVAYRSQLPLGEWAHILKQSGIPTAVSYHAGTYLCNAIMFLSHHWYHQRRTPTRITFVHLPLTSEQALQHHSSLPSMPVTQLAKALGILVDRLRGVQLELPLRDA